MAGEVTAGLRALLGRLQTFRVDWTVTNGKDGSTKDEVEYEEGIAIEESDLSLANVVSSLLKPNEVEEFLGFDQQRHVLALDIDVPAHLVQSSTPGHSHLYIEVPDGIPHHRYMALLSALADAKIIEDGYARISIKRGRTDLRLPWVRKGDKLPPKPEVAEVPPGHVGVDVLGSVDF